MTHDQEREDYDHEKVADLLFSIGWKSPSDAQWTQLRDALPQLRELLQAAKREPVVSGAVEYALNVKHPLCHQAADAFWKYWRENGETHVHGYYESTWGAINKAIRLVGIVPHDYEDNTKASPTTTPRGG